MDGQLASSSQLLNLFFITKPLTQNSQIFPNLLAGPEEWKQKVSYPGAERNAGNGLRLVLLRQNTFDKQPFIPLFNMYPHQDIMKHQKLRRVPSRRGMGRNVGEAELLQVLQRRRRAMGDQQDQTQGTLSLSSLSFLQWILVCGFCRFLRVSKQSVFSN